MVGSSVVVLAPLLCLAIFGGLSIGIGISIASGSRTAVVLVVSGPSTGLGALRSRGGSLSSRGALLALGVAVRDGNVGRGARVGRRGAGILLDGARAVKSARSGFECVLDAIDPERPVAAYVGDLEDVKSAFAK